MAYTPSKSDEMLTVKDVKNKLLPQVTRLRESLQADLVSLRYIYLKVKERREDCMDCEEYALHDVPTLLERVEEMLR